jgi:hypothetical protein
MTEAVRPVRIWHPMFDPYHCGFRMLRLLFAKSPQEVEVLFILDFYLLFPFLLHAASMPETVRARFRALKVERQQDQFVQVPSPQSLYRDLSVIQRTSLAGLVARKLVDPSEFQRGLVYLDLRSVPVHLNSRIARANRADAPLIDFLVNAIATIGLHGPRGLRSLTGLIRRTPS